GPRAPRTGQRREPALRATAPAAHLHVLTNCSAAGRRWSRRGRPPPVPGRPVGYRRRADSTVLAPAREARRPRGALPRPERPPTASAGTAPAAPAAGHSPADRSAAP